jgi:hypothetical protein
MTAPVQSTIKTPHRPKRAGRIVTAVARRKWFAPILCGGLAFLVGISFVAIDIPTPRVHDEFSYLLAADTFSHGRMTNRTHPMWEHFESFHVIQQPSYASKYQPGQGLLLALGTLIGGHPIVGACLGSALAAAAVCWMLQGWVPGRWALLGGLLVAFHGMIHIRWSISYWGGAIPMAGGALVFGSLPRIIRGQHARDSLWMALGAILLAATRPFEGLIVCLATGIALLWWLIGPDRPAAKVVVSRLLLPALSLLLVGLSGLAHYNRQVTGNPWRMPYQVHEDTYAWSPLFLWQPPKEKPTYRHAVMERLQTGWGMEDYKAQQTVRGLLAVKGESTLKLWHFYLGVPLTIPLLALPWLLRRGRHRFAWMTLAMFYLATLTVPWTLPHYFAPAASLLVLLIVLGMRHFAVLARLGRRWAMIVLPAVLLLHLATLGFFYGRYSTWQQEGWEYNRERLLTQLQQTPDKHLVIVRYAPDHNGHAEWVYNRADIDQAKVVWAREMGPPKDQALIDYFSDRHIWLLEADAQEPRLKAWESGESRHPANLRGVN